MKNNNKNLTKKDEKILMVFLVSIIIFLEVVLIIYVVANTQLFQFILAMVFIIIFSALFFSITWGLPTIMYSFLLEPQKELPPAGSWVDYLDPDYVLKVSYAHTVQEKS